MARRRKGRNINGILLVDKHQGESSNAIVQQIKRLYGAAKAGHTGALDPLATGMLPICLGEATKFSQFLLNADKTYEVEAQLGVRTDTSDADGEVVSRAPVNVSEAQLHEALNQFRGKLKQIPSMYSALKHEGHPLYYYARKGINIERAPRDIEVYSNELLHFEGDSLRLRIHCSKGTYIRTIIDDLGERLSCGAHVRELRRISVADFPGNMQSVEQYAESVEHIDDAQVRYSQLDSLLLPMDLPVLSLPEVELDTHCMGKLQLGQAIALADTNYQGLKKEFAGDDNGDDNKLGNTTTNNILIRAYGPDRVFLGMVELMDEVQLQPKRLVVYSPDMPHPPS